MLLTRFDWLAKVTLIAATSLTLTSCVSPAPSGDYISDGDRLACEQFESLAIPYDGSNESLWDSDAMESYQYDVEDAAQYAEETDLVDYFDTLDGSISDVITGQTDGSEKSDVESWMDDVANASDDVASQCELILYP